MNCRTAPAKNETVPLLAINGIEKSYGPVRVLNNVSFALERGQVLAVMGENGAGKSTLMNILSGFVTMDQGAIYLDGEPLHCPTPGAARNAGIVMVQQELSLVPELSVAENIFLGAEPTGTTGMIDRRGMNAAAHSILDRLAFGKSPDLLARDLRVGEQQLVEIARALAQDMRVLILDEPTTALAETEVELLFTVVRALQREGVAVLYISHRMDEIFEIASDVIVMRDGEMVCAAPVSSLDRDKLVRHMTGGVIREAQAPVAVVDGEVVLTVDGLWRGGRFQSGRRLLDNISFDLKQGEILGIAGLMGAGRTELLEVLSGACSEDWGGTITLEGEPFLPRSPADGIRRGVACLTEDRKGNGLITDHGIDRNISLASLEMLGQFGWIDKKAEGALAVQSISDLAIRATGPDHVAGQLSGGNQQKVVLAKWLATEPRLLLLDEPTKGIDIGAKAAIYGLFRDLAARGLSMLLVSSEWVELMALSNRVLVLRDGRCATILEHDQITRNAIVKNAMPVSEPHSVSGHDT